MKVLVLSPYADLIEDTINVSGCETITREPTLEISDWPDTDWVVSFGYRKIIPFETIAAYEGRIINIHGSLLPWNKGAHPNFWSWWDKTPKGVTIHLIDSSIDGGTVLARHIVADGDFRFQKTLTSTYEDLLVASAGLFKRSWQRILDGSIIRPNMFEIPGTYHRTKDLDPYFPYLRNAWNTHVHEIMAMGDLYRGINGKP